MTSFLYQISKVFILAVLLFGCSTPSFPSVQVPVPSDKFTDQIYDCGLPIVKLQFDFAIADIKNCLTAEDYNSCLLNQLQFDDNTVTCVVRDIGVKAAIAVTKKDDTQFPIANAARLFIITHRLGFK